jgi:hypothetical protein
MKSAQEDPLTMTPNLVMEIFDLPVTFHRCLVTITGSVTAALMLSQAITWTETLAPASGGWFCKSQEEWFEETGLSRWEQQTARRVLRESNFIDERKLGLPAKLWFRVNKSPIWQALHQSSQRSEHPEL